MTGTALSHYRVISELGRGGMGIVYLAEDIKLDRQVAIKVLPPSALASEDDRARFYREAKAAAALNHPNIAQIYQIDEAVPEGGSGEEPRPFIAMEYIDGEPLEARIKRGPLKLKEAVRLAIQIAGALGEAHDKGIVHRDVKASNVMLTSKGDAKVLDFGLALTAASTKLTRMGSTLGTVAYMSPEQARGEEVDNRTDLWALGVVLYEMVAGRNPFGGDYEQAVVYSILNADPEPLTAVRTGVPMELERIVNKALAKDSDLRYQTAADFVADLRAIDVSGSGVSRRSTTTYSRVSQVAQPSHLPEKAVWRRAAPVAGLALLAGVLLTLLAVRIWGSDGTSFTNPVYSQINLPNGVTLEPGRSAPLALHRSGISLSPDGQTLVIVGSWQETTAIYRRLMSGARFERLTGTDGAYGVTFSPDGSRVAFYADNRLKTVSVDGGTPRDIADVSLPYHMLWLPDDRIVFSNGEGTRLEVVPASGGEAERVELHKKGDPSVSMDVVQEPLDILPNGNILMNGLTGLYEVDLDAATAERLTNSMYFALVGVDETIVFSDGFGLSVGRRQEDELIDVTTSTTLTDSLYDQRPGIPHVALDDRGSIVFVNGPPLSVTQLTWLEDGEPTRVSNIAPDEFHAFSISPDGRYLAISASSVSGSAIWQYDLERGTRTSLTSSGFNNATAWSPDGRHVYWGLREEEGWKTLRAPAGGTARVDTLVTPNASPEWVTPDGSKLGVLYVEDGRDWGLGYVDLERPEEIIPIANEEGTTEVLSRLSRAGDYVAYTSNRSGDYEIYVQPFPPTGERWQVSAGGGEEPVWNSDDSALFYRNGNRLYRVGVTLSDDGPEFGQSDVVFDDTFQNVGGYSFDISPVDNRPLILRTAVETPAITRLELITNYPALLGDR